MPRRILQCAFSFSSNAKASPRMRREKLLSCHLTAMLRLFASAYTGSAFPFRCHPDGPGRKDLSHALHGIALIPAYRSFTTRPGIAMAAVQDDIKHRASVVCVSVYGESLSPSAVILTAQAGRIFRTSFTA